MRNRVGGTQWLRVAFIGTACWQLGGQTSYSQNVAAQREVRQIAQSPQAQYTPAYRDGTSIAPSSSPTLPPALNEELDAPPLPTAGTAFNSALATGEFGAGGANTVAIADNVGYIDSAIIRSRFRLRYDSAYNNNNPDRADFFYAKCGCFSAPATLAAAPGIYDPRALGPVQKGFNPITGKTFGRTPPAGGSDPRVDYQEVSPYLEYAATRNFSAFIEMPARFLNPTFVANASGWSDMNLGFKYAFIADPDRFLTFQFRTYVPTGSGERGLGTNHATLEPGLLLFQRLGDRLFLSAELRDWIPVHDTDFGGNVLRYGLGLSYNLLESDHFRLAPVTEFVGWSILSGKELSSVGVVSAAGTTIVNGKFGLRLGLGDYRKPGGGSSLNDRHSFYLGYGRALTGDHWYTDIIRLEYNYWF